MKNVLYLSFTLFLLACTNVSRQPEKTAVLINAIMYDGYELANDDEMVSLINITDSPVDVSGWKITDNDSGTAVLPPNTILEPSQTIWLTKNGTAASNRYHHVTDYEWEDSHTLIDNLSGSWPGLTDAGDELLLLNANGQIVDMLVFKSGTTTASAWSGTSIQPIYLEEEGIFLQRTTTLDSNSAADWEQVSVILENGREIGSPRRMGQPLTKK